MIDNNHVGGGIGFIEFVGNHQVEIKIGDIRDYDFIKCNAANVDKVVHLAAIVGEPACDKDESGGEVNVKGTLNVLKHVKKIMLSILHFMSAAGSCSVQDDSIIANENTLRGPISFYAKTKLDMEQAISNSTMLFM